MKVRERHAEVTDSSSDLGLDDAAPARETRLTRQGAALLLDAGDGGTRALLDVMRALDRQLLALARDIELYALVARVGSPTVASSGPSLSGADRALSEHRLWELECFSKPLVTLMSGAVPSMALALALSGTHRVAGEDVSIRLADLRQGALPSGLVMHALSRLPSGVAAYLLLAGACIGADDALALGLVTHCIAERHFDAITSELADADPVDPVLDVRQATPKPGMPAARQAAIAAHFALRDQAAIIAALRAADGVERAWALDCAEQVAGVPAAAAAVSLWLLEQAQALDMRDTIILAMRANVELARQASGAADVADILRRLEVGGANDLALPTRAELQSLRRPAS